MRKVATTSATAVASQAPTTPALAAPVPVAEPIEPSNRWLKAEGGKSYLVGPRFAAGSFGAVHRAIDVAEPWRRLVAKEFFVGEKGAKVRQNGKTFSATPKEYVQRELQTMDDVQSPLRPEAQIGTREGEQETLLAIMPHMDGDLSYLAKGNPIAKVTDGDRRVMLRSAIAQAADDLVHVHRNSYLHRDIKGQNIYFDAAGKVSIGDFGLAARIEDLSGFSGTPTHMAPEVMLKRPYGTPAEVWSLFETWTLAVAGEGKHWFAPCSKQAAGQSQQKAFLAAMEQADDFEKVMVLQKEGFQKILLSANGPLERVYDALTDWAKTAPPGAQAAEGEDRGPFGATYDAAWHFDAPMTELGLKHVLLKDPAQRISMAGLRDAVRALQPLDSAEEKHARAKFGDLAESKAARTQPAAEQYASLREEAALLGN